MSSVITENDYLQKVNSNYSDNRSELQEAISSLRQRNHNLSEKNDRLRERVRLLENQVNDTISFGDLNDYRVNIAGIDIVMRDVLVISFALVVVFTISFPLKLFGYKGIISLQGLEKILKKLYWLLPRQYKKKFQGIKERMNKMRS